VGAVLALSFARPRSPAPLAIAGGSVAAFPARARQAMNRQPPKAFPKLTTRAREEAKRCFFAFWRPLLAQEGPDRVAYNPPKQALPAPRRALIARSFDNMGRSGNLDDGFRKMRHQGRKSQSQKPQSRRDESHQLGTVRRDDSIVDFEGPGVQVGSCGCHAIGSEPTCAILVRRSLRPRLARERLNPAKTRVTTRCWGGLAVCGCLSVVSGPANRPLDG
jgi:hypothetical protein